MDKLMLNVLVKKQVKCCLANMHAHTSIIPVSEYVGRNWQLYTNSTYFWSGQSIHSYNKLSYLSLKIKFHWKKNWPKYKFQKFQEIFKNLDEKACYMKSCYLNIRLWSHRSIRYTVFAIWFALRHRWDSAPSYITWISSVVESKSYSV